MRKLAKLSLAYVESFHRVKLENITFSTFFPTHISKHQKASVIVVKMCGLKLKVEWKTKHKKKVANTRRVNEAFHIEPAYIPASLPFLLCFLFYSGWKKKFRSHNFLNTLVFPLSSQHFTTKAASWRRHTICKAWRRQLDTIQQSCRAPPNGFRVETKGKPLIKLFPESVNGCRPQLAPVAEWIMATHWKLCWLIMITARNVTEDH